MGFRSFSGSSVVATTGAGKITTAVSAKAVEAEAAEIGHQGCKHWSLDKNSAAVAGLVQLFFTYEDEDAACFMHGCRYFNAATISTFTVVVLLMFNTIASLDEAGTKAAGFAQEPHFRPH